MGAQDQRQHAVCSERLVVKVSDAIALIIVLIVAWMLFRAHRLDPTFDFFEIFKENGRVSKWSCVVLGAFGALTYVFVGMYRDGKMTEGLLLSYGGLCFAPLVAKMFATPSTTTTVVSTSSTELVEKKS